MYNSPIINQKTTSPYGWRVLNGVRGFHDGIDFVDKQDDRRVRSIGNATCVYDFDYYDHNKRWKEAKHSAGNYIIMQTEIEGNLYFIRYLHLIKNTVALQDSVLSGHVLGEYADAGYSFGAHLHIDMYDIHWVKIDPTPILKSIEVI